MYAGLEPFDKLLLESLENKYQIFLEAPEGEINVYLALNKNDELKSSSKQNSAQKEASFNYSNFSDNTLNMLDN
jgi:hypothetical protein